MELVIGIIIGALVGIIAGFVINRFLLNSANNKLIEAAKAQAELYAKEAEIKAEKLKQEKLTQVNERYEQRKSQFEKEANSRKEKLDSRENQIKQKEGQIAQRQDEFKKIIDQVRKEQQEAATQKEEALKMKADADQLREQHAKHMAALNKKHEEVEEVKRRQVNELQKIAGMSAEEARQSMMNALIDEARTKAVSYIKDIMDDARLTANKESKKIIIETIQRTAAETTIENAITVFPLENDDVKGRIIGREGRNIRALEAATGVEIIVDDTPDAIILSCFDPVKREVARKSLHKLVLDGRIHPARIEEVVKKVERQLLEEMMEIGERTSIDLGIHGLHADIIRHIGRMKYRSSYGQNLLQHSREVANLCETMAAEIGLDNKYIKLAKRAGLLHDIGKVAEEQSELPHALLGMKICEKYKEDLEVLNAIGAHHDEIEMTSIISPIIQACDAISGARPGARREIVESYLKRLKELEEIALSHNGVTKTYAIQAGRELRVIVESEKVSDEGADKLALDISQKIQSDMQYPGHIKVTVIRERRSVAIAK